MKKEVRGIHKKSILWGMLLPAILGILLYGLRMIPWVAEYVFARGITRWLTNFLTWLTNLASFSVAEWILYFIPVGLLSSLIYCVVRGGIRHFFRWICGVLSILLWGICLFEVLFVIQFGRIRLEDQLGYETGHITAEELYESAVQMRELAAQLSSQITYTTEGYSVWEDGMTLQDSNAEILAYSSQRTFEAVNRTLGLDRICLRIPYVQRRFLRRSPFPIQEFWESIFHLPVRPISMWQPPLLSWRSRQPMNRCIRKAIPERMRPTFYPYRPALRMSMPTCVTAEPYTLFAIFIMLYIAWIGSCIPSFCKKRPHSSCKNFDITMNGFWPMRIG